MQPSKRLPIAMTYEHRRPKGRPDVRARLLGLTVMVVAIGSVTAVPNAQAGTAGPWQIKAREEGCVAFSTYFEQEISVTDTSTPQQLLIQVRAKWPSARLHVALDYFNATREPGDPPLAQHPWARHFTKTNAYVIDIDSGLQIPIFKRSLCETLGIPLK